MFVLYTMQSFKPVYAIACLPRWCSPRTIVSFFKIWFMFSFFLCHRNSFENHTPTKELVQQQGWFYCELFVQCTSTVNIAKKHLLVYKIVLVAFELKFKKMPSWSSHCMDAAQRLLNTSWYKMQGRRWQGRWLLWHWASLVRVCSYELKQCIESSISLSMALHSVLHHSVNI